MKKTIAILLVAIMALGLFAACGSSNKLVGTWELTGGEGEEAEQTVAMMKAFGLTMTFTFKSNGKGSMDAVYGDETESTEFTYEAKDGKLTMTPVDEDEEVVETEYRIEGKKLYMTYDGEALVFTKK